MKKKVKFYDAVIVPDWDNPEQLYWKARGDDELLEFRGLEKSSDKKFVSTYNDSLAKSLCIADARHNKKSKEEEK